MVRVKRVYKTDNDYEVKGEMTLTTFMEFLQTLDTNKDGQISKEELSQAIRDRGGWFASWKAKRGVKAADANLNGVIDKDEIPNLVAFAAKQFKVKVVEY